MCGIVGYTGPDEAQPVLLAALARLEYRGYDSAGVAVAQGGRLGMAKAEGRVAALGARLKDTPLTGHCGIGHTRWATHGAPLERNAHPHSDASGVIAVVHNGIIENHDALRAALTARGVAFRSDTDTETVPHLLAEQGATVAGLLAVARQLEGSYALAVIAGGAPGEILAIRHGSPLIAGLGEGAVYLASDAHALLPYTRQLVYLPEDHAARLTPAGLELFGPDGAPAPYEVSPWLFDDDAAEPGEYPHFMLKEIHEQPAVLRKIIQAYTTNEAVKLPLAEAFEARLAAVNRAVFVACGTAWHAALAGRAWFERWARLPAEAEVASEFRYGQRPLDARTLVIAVSQSGETADTLAAIRLAHEAGAPTLAVVNVQASSIAREAGAVVYTLAGAEVGVASTKAYTAQLGVLALLALRLADLRGALGAGVVAGWLHEMRMMPQRMETALGRAEPVRALARRPEYSGAANAMFIGRGMNYPTALEGALKLKEISYIHVEGYAAGEMKHGPIALVTPGLPVVAVAVPGPVHAKTLSNMEELRARGACLLAVGADGDDQLSRHASDFIAVPPCPEELSPLLLAIPLQLFAYEAALALGRDIDRPRNLAKSVTVE